jgi:Effector Associated Constant Component 1
LLLTPSSDRFVADDARWGRQVQGLWAELEEQAGAITKRATPQPGAKGGTEAVILALGSAGAITAFVDLVKAWLSRDRTRSLEITTVDDHHGERTVRIRGDHIDNLALLEALKSLKAEAWG